MARPAAMTKLGPQRIHPVRVRGGNKKFRALRLDQVEFNTADYVVSNLIPSSPLRKSGTPEIIQI